MTLSPPENDNNDSISSAAAVNDDNKGHSINGNNNNNTSNSTNNIAEEEEMPSDINVTLVNENDESSASATTTTSTDQKKKSSMDASNTATTTTTTTTTATTPAAASNNNESSNSSPPTGDTEDFFACIVCYTSFPVSYSSYLTENCQYCPLNGRKQSRKYRVCRSCLQHYCLDVLRQGFTDEVPCLYGGVCSCRGKFDPDLLRIFEDSPQQLEKCHNIINKRLLREKFGDEYIECAYPDCDYAELLDPCRLNEEVTHVEKSKEKDSKNASSMETTDPLTDAEVIHLDDSDEEGTPPGKHTDSPPQSQPHTPQQTSSQTTTTTDSLPSSQVEGKWHCRMCNRDTCIKHRIPFHENRTCKQYDESIRETEEKTQQWISQNTRKCPHCGLILEKHGGCAEMQCRCHHSFQWTDLSSIPYYLGVPALLGCVLCLGCSTCCFCCCCFGRFEEATWDPRNNEQFRRWV